MYLLNRDGIYYYQRVLVVDGCRKHIRRSLRTRDPKLAQLLALQLYHSEIAQPARLDAAFDAAIYPATSPRSECHTHTSADASCSHPVNPQTLHKKPNANDTISKLVNTYIDHNKTNWSPKEQTVQQRYINAYIKFAVEKGFICTDKEPAVEFKQSLLDSKRSPTTINKYLSKLFLFVEWLCSHGHCETNAFSGLKLKRVKETNPRSSYSKLEIKIFDEWAMSLNKPWRKWIALIGRYSGMRLNEVCQLYTENIVNIDDVWCFKVVAARSDQKLKNKNSERLVPIHRKLIELGLLDFIEDRRKLNTRIFRELNYRQDSYAHLYSRWFSINKPVKSKDYHSLRHFVATELKANGVQVQYAAALLGHTTQSITYDRYGGSVPILKLKEALDSIL